MAPPPREAFHGQGGAAAHKIKKAVHIIFEPLCPLKGRQPFWQRGWNQMKRSTGLWTAGALIFAIVIGVFSVYSYNLNTRAGQEAQRPVTDLPIEGEGEIPEDYQYIPVSYTHLNLLPFPVISAAANGDTTAMCAILKHYEGYIAKLCTRTLKDDAGNTYSYVGEEMRNRLQVRLITRTLAFHVG